MLGVGVVAMLPVHEGYRPVSDGETEGSSSRLHTVQASSPDLLHTLAWGALAESLTSVCCPIVTTGEIDISATALNISGAFFAGVTFSLQTSAGNTRLHATCIAFQAGFIGVFTSFTFLAEQAARLAGGEHPSYAAAMGYIILVFAAQLMAFAAAIALLNRFTLPSVPSMLTKPRGLMGLVAVICIWVLFSPAGAVSDPLQIDAPHLAMASKAGDVLQLGAGLLFQAAGLWVSLHLSGSSQPSMLAQRTVILWGPLRCNIMATSLLLAVRASPCDAFVAARNGEALSCSQLVTSLVAKLCSSACGAISVSGGLSPAIWSLWLGGGKRRRLKSALNLAIHTYLAFLIGWALAWRSALPRSRRDAQLASFPVVQSPPMLGLDPGAAEQQPMGANSVF